MTTTNFELPILYHGTDLRFVNFPEDLRKNYHQYCYYLRKYYMRGFLSTTILVTQHMKVLNPSWVMF